jgi:hypothetical protein
MPSYNFPYMYNSNHMPNMHRFQDAGSGKSCDLDMWAICSGYVAELMEAVTRHRQLYPTYKSAAEAAKKTESAVPPPVCSTKRMDKETVVAAHKSRFNIESKFAKGILNEKRGGSFSEQKP